ncbi:Aste57867_12719 [Aphanomyces stellatus]|uniref:RNA helicase n=1 Tax=Aphanomyces stellatus TaxID=120398 RepID=A0A485KWQ0_9STRA|nr:hypothetical protein As57867_012671 [Aphanomyces stellatus]VFT89569.1 Aste57867_12719 [Aphanomyces stellatus]
MTTDQPKRKRQDEDDGMSAAEWREMHLIEFTSGGESTALPDPMRSFASTPFSDAVQATLAREGFVEPTPTQAQSWPIALLKQDMISIAKTGSGKTLAFLLPSFHLLAKAKRVEQTRTKQKHKYAFPIRSKEPRVVVIVPTRELAMQIEKECKKLLRTAFPQLRAVAVFGGADKKAQSDALEQGVDCLVATPGRLLDFRDRLVLTKVSILVLDEADKMLELGFEPQLQAIRTILPPTADRQTLLFSATWPVSVEALAAIFTRPNAIHLTIGAMKVNGDIMQQIVPCEVEADKTTRLVAHCQAHATSKTIVFFKTKQRCDDAAAAVAAAGVTSIAAVHGDKSQEERTMQLNAFKNGSCLRLFATDVASRGLHVNDVATVVNFDVPDNQETYIHRIGRTGRAGASGVAVSYVLARDVGMVRKMTRLMADAGQTVPDDVRAWLVAQQAKQHNDDDAPKPKKPAARPPPKKKPKTKPPAEQVHKKKKKISESACGIVAAVGQEPETASWSSIFSPIDRRAGVAIAATMMSFERQKMVHAIASDLPLQRQRLLRYERRRVLAIHSSHGVDRVYECLRECRADLDIADAVVVHQGELLHWYFTSRDGEVREKQPYNVSLIEIKKVFVKQGLQQTSNVARKLAVLCQEVKGEFKFTVLPDVQFNTHVCNPNSHLWATTYLVMPYICGKFGPTNATFAGKYCRNVCGQKARVKFYKPTTYFMGTIETYTRIVVCVINQHETRSLEDGMELSLPKSEVDDGNNNQLKELGSAYDDALKHDILKLAKYIEVGGQRDHVCTRLQVLQLCADFVLTDTCRLVLVRVSNIVFETDQTDAPVTMQVAKRRPVSAHPSTHPHNHAPDRCHHCPGHFCLVATANRRAVHHGLGTLTQNAISHKSIHVADQEAAFLAAMGHADSNVRLANELSHTVDHSTYRKQIPNLKNVDQLVGARNKLLTEFKWFVQLAQTVADDKKRVAGFYDMVHVCSFCYIMYQRLDGARADVMVAAASANRHTAATTSLGKSSSMSRLNKLAQPKKAPVKSPTKKAKAKGTIAASLLFDQTALGTTPSAWQQPLDQHKQQQGPSQLIATTATKAARCLRAPLAWAPGGDDGAPPVLSRVIPTKAELKPIVPRRKL